jgi:hypothetical protein
MRFQDFDPAEHSRSSRPLGNLYADLAPGIGKDMVSSPKEACEEGSRQPERILLNKSELYNESFHGG